MASVLETARAYVAAGLSVIPVRADGSKAPALPSWKEYQRQPPGDALLLRWFGSGNNGIAIVCGRVSGGLEVMDFDDAATFSAWIALAEDALPGLLARLPQVRTPGGGAHVYRRVERPGGNRKLALAEDGKALAELRGEGGYVLAPGCPPACHPSGRTYRHLAGPRLTEALRAVGGG